LHERRYVVALPARGEVGEEREEELRARGLLAVSGLEQALNEHEREMKAHRRGRVGERRRLPRTSERGEGPDRQLQEADVVSSARREYEQDITENMRLTVAR